MDSTLLEQNQLLNSLPRGCLARIRPLFEHVSMPLREVVEQPNEPITHVYFPLASILSVVAGGADSRIEVGIIGRDGMTGSSVVLGADSSPHECFVQIADGALRLSVLDLRAAMDADPVLRDHLLLYIREFMLQIAETALANGHGTIEERLARWLLMCQDRLDSSEILVTHESLSVVLGVRRSGVTLAFNGLGDAGVIETARGKVTIADRAGLEVIAGSIFAGHTQQAGGPVDAV